MNERMIHLRIKIKSLAAEAVIIRKEAHKTKGSVKHGLNCHRTGTVRHHARHNQLAYGLLRGLPYSKMETKCEQVPDFKMVLDLAKRFGSPSEEEIKKWAEEAKAHLDSQDKVKYLYSILNTIINPPPVVPKQIIIPKTGIMASIFGK